MSDSLRVDIIGMEQIFDILAILPTEVQDIAADDANEYLLNVFRTYPQYRYVSRARAYPEVGGWFSDKQRRYVMARIREGSIKTPYSRTQMFRNAWRIKGNGQSALIVNESPVGEYLMGDGTQSRMAILGGWERVDRILEDRKERVIKLIDGSIKKAMKKAGAK
jgi:hypothetical protein